MATQEEIDKMGKMWHAIGKAGAYADPDGSIARNSGLSPEQRLAEIGRILRELVANELAS